MTDETFPALSIDANGASGITIKAMLGEKYNCVEFTLRDDIPQPIFISPWMQFEPARMNEQRLKMAYEIVRRAMAYDELITQVDGLQKNLEQHRQTMDKRAKTQDTTYRMWKEDRARMGLPEDFSDIKVWPPEMMGDF